MSDSFNGFATSQPQPPPEPPEGLHRNPGSGGPGRYLLTFGIVLLLVVVAGGTVWWMYSRDPVADPTPAPLASASSGPACPPPAMRVAAAPDIAPVVQAAARSVQPGGGGECPAIQVVAEEPAATIAGLGKVKPDVWIPSSSAWLGMQEGRSAYTSSGDPLARTPVMLAAPSAVTSLFAKGDQTSWAALVGSAAADKLPAVTMADPQRSTVGLLSVYAVNAAMARTTPDPGIAQLQALTLRSRLKDAGADPAAVLRQVKGAWNANEVAYDVGAFALTEQQFKAYEKEKPTVQLQGAYPVDGLIDADYPYAVSRTTKQKNLAARLRSAITKPALTAAGFRTAPTPNAIALPEKPAELLGPVKMWSEYRSLKFQTLLLIDASGSMNQKIKDPAGRETTRAELLRSSGRTAAQLFGKDTSIGMWFFSEPSPSSPAHVEAVPFGPIAAQVDGKPRRTLLGAAITRYQAKDNAGTPLYQSVLDAHAEMQEKVSPGTVTLIVVLTDGEDGESRFSMSEAQFLTKLKAQSDPQRPVPVIGVGYGPDADMASLNAIATATGGQAIPAINPADLSSAMAKAFLAARLPR